MRGPVTERLLLSTPSTVKLLLRGRFPPTAGPEPAPRPPELATPAFNNDKFRTPLAPADIGTSEASFAVKVVGIVGVVASRVTPSSLTSTVVAVPAGKTEISTVAFLFSSTLTCVVPFKPEAAAARL